MTNWDFGDGRSDASSFDPSGSAPTSSTSTSGWGSETETGRSGGEIHPDPVTVVPGGSGSAPVVWLSAGLGCATLAIVLRIAVGSVAVASLGWLLAGPGAIGLLAVFITADTRRRAEPWYAASDAVEWLRRLLVVVAIVGVALCSWTIADWAARGGLG